MNTDFNNKVVLITGASRGIGKAIAESFCRSGATVFITAKTNVEKLDNLRKNYEMAKIYPYKVDFDNPNEIKSLFDFVSSKEGRLDVMVCNAGITIDKLILRLTKDEFEKVLRVNLESAFLCAKYASELMIKKRYGRIIFISSVSGLTGNVGQSAYSSTKSGLFGLTKTLAKELGSRGITVNTIAPGFVETEMVKALPKDYVQNIKESIPLKRFAMPEEIAATVLFLSSDKSSFITGQVLVVDGGLSLISF